VIALIQEVSPFCKSAALQAADKLDSEGGGGFNPRIKPKESMRALAPEGRPSQMSTAIHPFPEACLTVPIKNPDLFR
jgi:hypothetical protein